MIRAIISVVNCWEPLRAKATGNGDNAEDWAISSQAPQKCGEGSTTSHSNLNEPMGVTAERLRELYVERRMTARQIAKVLGVGHRTAARLLHRHGIEPRPPGATPIHKLRDQQWLRRRYVDERKSTLAIAEELGCAPRVVLEWIKRAGITARPRSQRGRKFSAESRARMSAARAGRFTGKANPNWKGGRIDPTARERRSYRAKQWRDAVKARDGYRCVECGETKRLHAHHIKPWKKAPELRYELSNGKTLCVSCHQAAHGFPFPAWIFAGETTTSATPSRNER